LATKAWLTVTGTHIYVAFDAQDPNPERIRSGLRAHDGGKEDDYVSFAIDTTGTGARKYEFRVNPHGSKGDTINDSVADRSGHDWDTDWEAAAMIHDHGYRVEMAVPIAGIRAPARTIDGRKGVIFFKRYIPRRLKTVNAGFIIYDANQFIEQVRKQEAENLPGSVSVTDKLSGTAHAIYHLDETRKIGESEWTQVAAHDEFSGGLDLVYQFDSSRSAALTLYPNYTDVEGDIARDGLSKAFKKFKPEKRTFFKAVSEYYISTVPAVYTRNIKQPRVGAVYVDDDAYKAGSGFIVTDKETEVIIPDTFGNERVKLIENSESAAFRIRGSNLDGNAIGVLGTARTADGYHNAVVGADGLWNIDDDNKVRYQVLVSNGKYPKRFAEDVCEKGDCLGEDFPEDLDDCPLGECSLNASVLRTGGGETLTGHYIKARYKNSTHRGEYFLDYIEASPDFRGDLGFIRQIDMRLISAMYGKKWYRTFLKDDGGRSRIRAYVNALHGRSHADNAAISTKVGAFLELSGSYQSRLSIGKSIGEKAVGRINRATLDVEDNAPLFDEDYWLLKFNTSPFASWNFDITGRFGDVADKNVLAVTQIKEISPKLNYRIGNVEIGLETIFREVELDGSLLYEEQWYTVKGFWRPNERMNHRLLYLDDLALHDVDRLPEKSNVKEVDRTVEYTFTYKPSRWWSILTGVKGQYDYRSEKDDSDWVNREFYFKVERHF
jgi:hypothetical protein